MSLEVWAASWVGLVLPYVHTRQTSVTLSAPPLLTMALHDATLSPANTHLTWLTSAGRRASSCPCQLPAFQRLRVSSEGCVGKAASREKVKRCVLKSRTDTGVG